MHTAKSQIMSHLRQETQALHAKLDSLPLMKRLVSPDITSDTYGQILSAYLRLYAPLETRLLRFTADFAHWDLDIGARIKAPALHEDLRKLDLDPQALEAWQQLPEIDSFAAAWGTLYVLEGATLGAQMIRRILHKSKLPLESQAFFALYGSHTQLKWHSFAAAIEAWSEQSSESESTFTAARATFQAFVSCITLSAHDMGAPQNE